MKNILILANGNLAKHFVEWVGKSRIGDNHYYIVCPNNNFNMNLTSKSNFKFINTDPTSYMRLQKIMDKIEFAIAFVVMTDRDESLYAFKNIRMIDKKILVILVSRWDDFALNDEDDDNISIININEIMAGHLYEYLPNVPVIAKNIGLGRGEIMEILVPFGSSFAYRHIGSLSHRKWRIVAVYRKEKQIFPNNAMMLKPNDTLIVIGNPIMLEGVYKTINQRKGLFPEPFGKTLYLILDMNEKREDILLQVNEAIFLSNQLSKTKLSIRLISCKNRKWFTFYQPQNSYSLLKELKKMENEYISINMSENNNDIYKTIDYDMSQLDIGLFLLNRNLFTKTKFKEYLYGITRPIYIFGEKSIYNINEAVILMGDEVQMESLSSSVFDIAETLGLKLSLCDFNPEGDYSDKEKIIEHYESLSTLYNFKINIVKKEANPITELRNHDDILHIAPFTRTIMDKPLFNFFSTRISRYFLSIKKHPQLLIPIEN